MKRQRPEVSSAGLQACATGYNIYALGVFVVVFSLSMLGIIVCPFLDPQLRSSYYICTHQSYRSHRLISYGDALAIYVQTIPVRRIAAMPKRI